MSAARNAEAANEPSREGADKAEGSGQWPFGVSRTPTMTIGSALALLQREFPAVRVSKIRFLEEQGLVSPQRTPSGYRAYSQADVERLRFCLAAQRDSFLPWKVVRERLAKLDSGTGDVSVPGARVVTADGELLEAEIAPRLTVAEVAAAADCAKDFVDGLVTAGLLISDSADKYPQAAVAVTKLALQLADHGVDMRHLRSVRNGAERQIDLIEQIVAPVRSQRTGPSASGARERSLALASELAQDFIDLHTALLRAHLERLS